MPANLSRTAPAELSRQIRAQALALGFSKVGIVRAEQLAEADARLREWLGRGYHGEMKWMDREPGQRTDPRRIFSDARSVVVVALNYYTPHDHTESSATGKVSRYAWGDDYHDVLGRKLRDLLSWIMESSPEADGRVCVDIQPTMDKAWAARAGLGWVGKHSNLITHEFGSWVFIGELFLNLELEYDNLEMADQCGSCTLCLDACPTGAIVEPYVVDANRCISYVTIESRAAEIPAGIDKHLEGWVYGCDICQDVCPWNQMAPVTTEPRFEPRPGNVNASLPAILNLTHETYVEAYRRSAMKRAKLTGLQRNARALLRNSQESNFASDV